MRDLRLLREAVHLGEDLRRVQLWVISGQVRGSLFSAVSENIELGAVVLKLILSHHSQVCHLWGTGNQ